MKKFNLCVASGTYTDKNGVEKTNWERIGFLIEKDGKTTMGINPIYDLTALYVKQCQRAQRDGKQLSDVVFINIFEDNQERKESDTKSSGFTPPPMPEFGQYDSEEDEPF